MTMQDFLARAQLYAIAAQMAAGTIAKMKKTLDLDLEAAPEDIENLNGQMLTLTHHYAEKLGEHFGRHKAGYPLPKIDRTPAEGAPQQAPSKATAAQPTSQRFSQADLDYLRGELGGDKPRLAPTNPPPGQRGRTPPPVTDDQGEDGANDE